MSSNCVHSIIDSYNRAIIRNREGWKQIDAKVKRRNIIQKFFGLGLSYSLPPSLPAPLSRSTIEEAHNLGLKIEK